MEQRRWTPLLSSILEHAKATSLTPSTPTGVDLQALANEVAHELRPQFHSAGGEIVIGALPALVADEGQLRRVLFNLLDNAYKYRHPDRAPIVEVRAALDGLPETVRLEVADNGLGVPPEHRSRIFGLFKRLSGEGEGTGVGLAVVRRIIEETGGSIRVEAGPEHGSIFVIDLPGELAVNEPPFAGRSEVE